MSETREDYVAACSSCTEFQTYYGVVTIPYGLYLKIKQVYDLLKIAAKEIDIIRSIECYDSYAIWFESMPWQADSSDETTETWEAFEKELRNEGSWLPVAAKDIDHENGQTVRTVSEVMSVDLSGYLHFTFYPKHSSELVGSPYLSIEDLDKHFQGG